MENEMIDFAIMLVGFISALGLGCAIQNWVHRRVPMRSDLDYIARQRSKAMRRRARRRG